MNICGMQPVQYVSIGVGKQIVVMPGPQSTRAGAGAGSLALSLYRGGHTTLTIAKENERQSYFFLLISSGSKCHAVQIILNMSLHLLRLSLDCQESERACAASFLLTGGGRADHPVPPHPGIPGVLPGAQLGD